MFDGRRFDALVVDPPWAYGRDSGRPNRTAEAHYKTIGDRGGEVNRRTGAGLENIIACAPVTAWAKPDSHLYLWTTNPKLPFAFAVLAAWGFVYKTTLTWEKVGASGETHRGGMGFFFRGATEHVLFGVRGHKPIPPHLRVPNLIRAKPARGLRGHSAKPDEFYSILEPLYRGEDKADVFARKLRPGWAAWGDEVPTPGEDFAREDRFGGL